MNSRRSVLALAISLGVTICFSEVEGRGKKRGRGYNAKQYRREMERQSRARARAYEEAQHSQNAEKLKKLLHIEEYQAGGILKLLRVQANKRETLINALSQSHKNRALSAALGDAGQIIYSRIHSEAKINDRETGMKIGLIIESTILASSQNPQRKFHMTSILEELKHELETNKSNSINSILDESIAKLVFSEKNIEDAGGNCCAEKTCECENLRPQ